MKLKNIVCIKGLLNIALKYGVYLKGCWIYVLDCVSRLDHLHSICHGGKTDLDIFQGKQKSADKEDKRDAIIENLMTQIDPGVIDKIFNRSVLLDGESILDFITCLCKLSEFFFLFT